MVINTPAARSMDWAAGFQREIVFILRVLGVLGRLADLRGGFFCVFIGAENQCVRNYF